MSQFRFLGPRFLNTDEVNPETETDSFLKKDLLIPGQVLFTNP